MDPTALIDAAPPIVVVARDGQVRFANPAAAQLCGARTPSPHVDAVLRWVDPPSSPGWRRALFLNATRAPVLVEVLSFPFQEQDGPVVAHIARPSAPASSVQSLIQRASHDLHEPLRMVQAYTELVQRRYTDALDSDGKEFLGFAADGARRMEGVVDGLLSLMRLRAEPPSYELCDTGACAADALAGLSREVEARGAKVRLEALPILLADPRRITRLFRELLDNALKFSKHAPQVRVGASDGPDGWTFRVADNGIGIEARSAERVFEPFTRLHPVGAFPGAGIGLAICQEIVQSHGGRIWVEGAREGSTFEFIIPRLVVEGASG